jgi:hypothetical protein
MQAQPSVSFYCRVPQETDARRRRLQAALDRCSIGELVELALRELESSLSARLHGKQA